MHIQLALTTTLAYIQNLINLENTCRPIYTLNNKQYIMLVHPKPG